MPYAFAYALPYALPFAAYKSWKEYKLKKTKKCHVMGTNIGWELANHNCTIKNKYQNYCFNVILLHFAVIPPILKVCEIL